MVEVDGIIQFDDDGRLYINHNCETCMKFPLENMNDHCIECGYSRANLIELEGLANRANKAIDMMAQMMPEDEKEIDVREAFLHVSEIKLGGHQGMDKIILEDIDMTDQIRTMADLADHMVRVIVYPTNMRHIEGDDYLEIYFGEDDE